LSQRERSSPVMRSRCSQPRSYTPAWRSRAATSCDVVDPCEVDEAVGAVRLPHNTVLSDTCSAAAKGVYAAVEGSVAADEGIGAAMGAVWLIVCRVYGLATNFAGCERWAATRNVYSNLCETDCVQPAGNLYATKGMPVWPGSPCGGPFRKTAPENRSGKPLRKTAPENRSGEPLCDCSSRLQIIRFARCAWAAARMQRCCLPPSPDGGLHGCRGTR
jgi:hypothetical protein